MCRRRNRTCSPSEAQQAQLLSYQCIPSVRRGGWEIFYKWTVQLENQGTNWRIVQCLISGGYFNRNCHHKPYFWEIDILIYDFLCISSNQNIVPNIFQLLSDHGVIKPLGICELWPGRSGISNTYSNGISRFAAWILVLFDCLVYFLLFRSISMIWGLCTQNNQPQFFLSFSEQGRNNMGQGKALTGEPLPVGQVWMKCGIYAKVFQLKLDEWGFIHIIVGDIQTVGGKPHPDHSQGNQSEGSCSQRLKTMNN